MSLSSFMVGNQPVHHPFLPDHRGTSQSSLDYPNDNQEGLKRVFIVKT